MSLEYYLAADCYGYELYEGNHVDLDACEDLADYADYNWHPTGLYLYEECDEMDTRVFPQPPPPQQWIDSENTTIVSVCTEVVYHLGELDEAPHLNEFELKNACIFFRGERLDVDEDFGLDRVGIYSKERREVPA